MHTFLRLEEVTPVIYADNAATTRISDLAFEKMLPFIREQYGNASSQYSLAVKSKRAVEQARRQIAGVICAQPAEITFTSGGSEGNSWVLQNLLAHWSGEPIHIITSSVEHHSVLNTCLALEKRGVAITYLPVDVDGRVSVANVISSVRSDTRLISIMLANNEVGTIQPLAEIGELLRGYKILFHTDAVQAVGHIPVNVEDLNVDLLTASSHKFNGTKGTGFVYIRSGLDLPPLIFGGEQEYGKRSGTENVAGIVAMGFALEESVINMASERERLTGLVRATADGLKAIIPGVHISSESASHLPGIMNMTFPDASGEAMMHILDMKGICVSTSSACNSGRDEPSHVLLAMGLSEQEAKSSIRISYGRYNTLQETTEIVKAISNAYRKIVDAK
jgi:cysteine desulfurase